MALTWLLRLPRILQVPIALAIVVGACFALASFVICLPVILLYLWIRRSLAERSAYRALLTLANVQAPQNAAPVHVGQSEQLSDLEGTQAGQ